jgi:hypothetical protein
LGNGGRDRRDAAALSMLRSQISTKHARQFNLIYEAVRVAAVTRAMTDEGATAKAIGQRIRQSPFNHSIGEYVRGNHTNAIDGHLPIFKRGCKALPTEKELAS